MKNFDTEPASIPDPLANIIMELYSDTVTDDADGDAVFSGYTGKTYFTQSIVAIDGDSTVTGTISESVDGSTGWTVIHTFDVVSTSGDFQTAEVNVTKNYVRYSLDVGGASEAPSVSASSVGVF